MSSYMQALTPYVPYLIRPLRDIANSSLALMKHTSNQAANSWWWSAEDASQLQIGENLITCAARTTFAAAIFFSLSVANKDSHVYRIKYVTCQTKDIAYLFEVTFHEIQEKPIHKFLKDMILTTSLLASVPTTFIGFGAYNITLGAKYLECAFRTLASFNENNNLRYIETAAYAHPLKNLAMGVGIIGLGILLLEQHDVMPIGLLEHHYFAPLAKDFSETIVKHFTG